MYDFSNAVRTTFDRSTHPKVLPSTRDRYLKEPKLSIEIQLLWDYKNGKTNPDLHNYKAARKKWNPSNLLTFTDKHKWEGEITSLSTSKFGTTNMTTYAVGVKR